MGERITWASGTGYLAVPPSGSGPGVVVVQEWWGLVPHIERVCDRFAAEGFVALAPDLYRGRATTEPDEAGKLMMTMNLEAAMDDLSSSIDHLRALDAVTSTGVGIVGFCMGGGLALLAAARRPDAVVACAPFYGVIPWQQAEPDWSSLGAVVRGHYAADDAMFPPEKVRALEAELRGLGKDVAFEIHPGTDHAFFNDDRPEVHNPVESQKAWTATVGFLRDAIR